MTVEWKKYLNTNYYVSTDGRVKYLEHWELPKIKKNNTWIVNIKIDGISKKRYVHCLMAEVFKKDFRIPYLETNGIHGKSGRPSRNKIKAISNNYDLKYSKYLYFIDGNRDNLNLDNIEFIRSIKTKRIVYSPKYNNVFYVGETLINQIIKNTNNSNKQDNDIIIKYLRGDNNSIGVLFQKYYNIHKSSLILTLKNIGSVNGKKRKEDAMELDDFIIECQIKIMSKIKKGRFDGVDFKKWSSMLVQKYLVQYFVIQNRKKKFLMDKTQSFIG